MNANVPAQVAKERTPVVAGGQVAALIPQSMEEAFRVANAIASSGLAPRGLDRPEQVLVAIMAGAELGLAPFQSLQSFAIVNNRPTLWGDGLMAVARSGGVKVREWLEGEGDARVAYCEVTRPDGEVIQRSFSVAQAKKAGLWGKQGPWTQYPERMQQMRARAWALRDGCADMLRGFQVREEVEDYEPGPSSSARAAAGTGMRARLEARQAVTEPNGGFDAEHIEGELSEAIEAEFTEADTDQRPEEDRDQTPADEAAPSEGAWDHMAWAQAMREAADTLKSADDVQAWFNDVVASAEYAQLIEADEAEALALKAHVVRRKKALVA
jgi:hypothetical protein